MEIWDLYDENRQLINQKMMRGEQQPAGTYRLVVHVCLFNSRNQMLIQQRQPFKEGWSDMWDISVGCSAISGETSQQAAQRELAEELGIHMSFAHARPYLTVYFDQGFDDFYFVDVDAKLETLHLQKEEVKAVQWADLSEILERIEQHQFIPYHQAMIELLFLMKQKRGVHQEQQG